ncbi:hypothetical protein QJS66_12845 [Kocuria rhizophila]|nr:hypothetical protein QJS66_12845 [Kocuria rhizophila]
MVASIPSYRPVRFAVVGVGQISQQAFHPRPGPDRGRRARCAGDLQRREGGGVWAAGVRRGRALLRGDPALLESGRGAVYVATPVFRHRESAEPH